MLMFICDVKRRNVTWDGAKAEVCIDSQLTISGSLNTKEVIYSLDTLKLTEAFEHMTTNIAHFALALIG